MPRYPKAVSAALILVAVAVVGCGAASPAETTGTPSTTAVPSTTVVETPSTTVAATTSAPTTTLEPTTTTASAPMPTVAIPNNMPSTVYACGVGGYPIYEISRIGDDWGVTDQYDPPQWDPATPNEFFGVEAVTGGPEGLYVSTCCEPTSGVGWLRTGGAYKELGYGVVTDSTHDVSAAAYIGAPLVRLYSSSRHVDLEGAFSLSVHDAALSPAGGLAVLTMEEYDVYQIYWVPNPGEGGFDDAGPLYESDTRLDSIAVDRDSRIWLGSAEEPELVIVDTATGRVETETLEHKIVDLASDASGAYMLITTDDGRITARRFDESTSTVIPSPKVDRADW